MLEDFASDLAASVLTPVEGREWNVLVAKDGAFGDAGGFGADFGASFGDAFAAANGSDDASEAVVAAS